MRATPETDAFYSTFADGLACPTQEEWLDRLKRYERQRDELLEAIANALHDPSISAKSKRPLADAFSSVREGKP